MRRVTLILCLFLLHNSNIFCQAENLFPVIGNPNVVLDEQGKFLFELPEGYKIINAWDGKHDMGWAGGMADTDIGECGNILAWNMSKRNYAMFDAQGNFITSLGDYLSVTPCSEGFHLGEFKDPKSSFGSKRYRFIKASGEIVFKRDGFYKADIFIDGLAAVRLSGIGWHYINTLGHEKKLIPDTLKNITEVSSFYSGLSMIKLRGKKIKDSYKYALKVYFIDQKGEIKIDLGKLFPDRIVTRVSPFYSGISIIEFYKPKDAPTMGSHIAYINTKGEVICDYENIEGYRPPKTAYASFMLWEKDKPYVAKLYDVNKNELVLPKVKGLNPTSIHHVGENVFQVNYRLGEKEYEQHLFDAQQNELVYQLGNEDPMGVRFNLFSFKESKTKRHFVIDRTTKEIVYDTKIENQVVRELTDKSVDFSRIKTMLVTKEEDLKNISQLTNCEELTFRNLDLESLPDLTSLSQLKLLRIDNCRQLKSFPTNIHNLEQLSLRNCTSATNVYEFVINQKNLKKLFVINFDLTYDQKLEMKAICKDSRVSGTRKGAESMLEEVLIGF